MQNFKLEREVKNRADWEKSIKRMEVKVRVGQWCHLRKRSRNKRMRFDAVWRVEVDDIASY